MKTAGSILLCFVVTGALSAAESAALSDRLKAEVRANLPAYTPPPAKPADTPTAAGAADPDVLVLPKLIVKEKRIPTHDPDVWRSERDIQQRAMQAYQDSMTPLEWALNSWFVPLFSAPASVRARAAYRENKLTEELSTMAYLAEIGQRDDAQISAAVKTAVGEMQKADDWQSRPAGGK
ncbi:MAG: hypothetical protein PSW75_04220 [bacterium]|nr:hypothetical protein [bacterium]MDI1336923.1 hypothetical protein [Lacunisphaera sp.]